MTSYRLTIKISTTGVKEINTAKQHVTIAHEVHAYVSTSDSDSPQSLSGSGMPSVAWLAEAAEQTLTITWSPSYSLYATEQPLKTGHPILANAQIDATSGHAYTFQSDHLLKKDSVLGEASSFAVDNQVGADGWSFGLALVPTVNGTSLSAVPLKVAPALTNEKAVFKPSGTVRVFLQSYAGNGMMLPNIPDNACTVSFTAGNSASVTFDEGSSCFVVDSSA